jgi:6-phosphofructokinase 1
MNKRLAVLTSGGDAPGMNAAVRAVTRCAIERGFEVFGVRHGYAGLVAGELRQLGARDVGGILPLGGTLLGSARCAEMRTPAGQQQALRTLAQQGIQSLVVIGGNGSQTGAMALAAQGVAVVGVASTIDNDLLGTDITIGATTAIDVALESVDRLRVTAASHRRGFLVEVMGRDCGYLAAMVGIAGGAEAICVPELPQLPEAVAEEIHAAYRRGKTHALVVVAEGAAHDADALARWFETHAPTLGFDMRVCRLGHVQRGGAPGVADRLLATRLGAAAVEHLARGEHGVLIGQVGGGVTATPLAEVAGRTKPLDLHWLALARTLAS